MTDQTNKDLPLLPPGTWARDLHGETVVYTADETQAVAHAAVAADRAQRFAEERAQLEQEWCNLRSMQAALSSAPAAGSVPNGWCIELLDHGMWRIASPSGDGVHIKLDDPRPISEMFRQLCQSLTEQQEGK